MDADRRPVPAGLPAHRFIHPAWIVNFAGQIPVFLLSAISGYTADGWNRHTDIVLTQGSSMVLALALAVLVLAHRAQIWQIFVLASLLGLVNGFEIAAQQSFLLVEMAGGDDLIHAIALNSSMFSGAPARHRRNSGREIGEGWCFFVNGISYIAVVFDAHSVPPQGRRPPLRPGRRSGRVLPTWFIRGPWF